MQRRGALVDWIVHRRGLRRWAHAARRAHEMPLAELRRERTKARNLLYVLNEVVAIADNRLALPMIGSNAFPKPPGTDWAWRPALWTLPLASPGISAAPNKSRLGEELTLFHDCARSELTLRQVRNTRDSDLAPYGLRMDVFAFDGSFLSAVVDLPQGAVEGLKKRHLLRMTTIIELEKPLEIFARINIKHGPNTEQIVRELPLDDGEIVVEFDLAYTGVNEKRIERIWVDLIFENPEMSQVVLRDLTFSRRPRAEL
ncbi:MAG TPA: DUF6478 family protein [Roseovarius sp.]